MTANDVTAIITTHNRPKDLLRAFYSCLNAGFKAIIVSITGIVPQEEIDTLREKYDSVIATIWTPHWRDSNEAWLRAVKSAGTQYVCILHDDDMYMPGLLAKAMPRLTDKCNLVMWAGSFIGHPRVSPVREFAGIVDGENSSGRILEYLGHQNVYAISPVRGVYPRNQAQAVFEECRELVEPLNLLYRDDFVIGNDLLLWWRLAEWNPVFSWMNEVGVQFGTEESTTRIDMQHGINKLGPLYDRVREYAKNNERPNEHCPALPVRPGQP